jgi:hypothetical protein
VSVSASQSSAAVAWPRNEGGISAPARQSGGEARQVGGRFRTRSRRRRGVSQRARPSGWQGVRARRTRRVRKYQCGTTVWWSGQSQARACQGLALGLGLGQAGAQVRVSR